MQSLRARVLFLFGFGLLLNLNMATSSAVPAESHLARASRLILAGGETNLSAACTELALSYDESHEPILLLRLGRLHQRLGQKTEAEAAYKRFLAESKAPHPALRTEAEEALRALAPPPPSIPPLATDSGALASLPPFPEVYGQAPMLPQASKRERRKDPRLMKIGSLLLAAGYLPAFVIPLALSTSLDQENAPSPAANYTLLIPVLGPFVSGMVAPLSNENGHAGQVASSWSVPWMATSGVLQVAGLSLIIMGALPRTTSQQ